MCPPSLMAFYTEEMKSTLVLSGNYYNYIIIIMANDRQPVISYSCVTVATALSVFIIEMLMM